MIMKDICIGFWQIEYSESQTVQASLCLFTNLKKVYETLITLSLISKSNISSSHICKTYFNVFLNILVTHLQDVVYLSYRLR